MDLFSCRPIRFRNLNRTADENCGSLHKRDRNESTQTGSTPAVPAKRTSSSKVSNPICWAAIPAIEFCNGLRFFWTALV
jgi:hypothetical protein